MGGLKAELYEVVMDSGLRVYVDKEDIHNIEESVEYDIGCNSISVKSYHFCTEDNTASTYPCPVTLVIDHISSWRAFKRVTILAGECDNA